MKLPTDLRAQAAAKRHMADFARRVGPGLSLAADRQMLLQHAHDLEAEAQGLDLEAGAVEAAAG